LFRRRKIDLSSGKALGYYILCVSLYQLGYQLWTHSSANVLQGWSRFGFRVIILDLLVDDDQTVPKVYRLSILWLLGLAILMLWKRSPLRTYIVGEILLGLPTVFFLTSTLGPSSLRDRLSLGGVFLLETEIPLVWALILLVLKEKSQLRGIPIIVLERTKALGYYLLGVSLYQLAYFGLFALFHLPDSVRHFNVDVYPRLALLFGSQTFKEEMMFFREMGLGIWLLELALAILMICGRQPLKTYVVTEVLLGIPSAALVAVLWFSDVGWRMRLLQPIVFLLVTGIPVFWACRLLWVRKKARHELSVS